ncbi:MAG TPA: hypothetical protein VMB05_15635 [Solirubrobacteraceae bacterium]|nr:hypothetical protein [Solirubrobacteraceae bacterium]
MGSPEIKSRIALALALVAVIFSTTGLADAARHAVSHAIAKLGGHRVSTKPYAKGLLLLGKNKKFPAAAIPTVKNATNSSEVGGMKVDVLFSCPPTSVDLGTWCLMTAPFPVSPQQATESNWFWASQKCVEEGGFLPSAAQLIGAANRVRLESTIHDSPLTATVQIDPSVGLKDQREMSSTLVTTAAGSDAAGSEGVSQGATGNPRTGEPNPSPLPAVPQPETTQYVTVYSNHQKGGLAGSEPVSHPENFRCGFYKSPGAINKSEG